MLISALAGCAEGPHRARSRRFLQGLSSDELRFIAEYLGACILESDADSPHSREEFARRVLQFQAAREHPLSADEEHKMVLLLEFLCRGGVSAALRAQPS